MKNEKKEKEKGVSLNKYKVKAELQSKRVQKGAKIWCDKEKCCGTAERQNVLNNE